MVLNSPQTAEIDPTVYQSLFATLQAPILFIDGQTGAILDANPAACAFYGCSHDALTLKTIFDISALTPEETRQRVSQIAAGETAHMHSRHRLANGEIRDVGVLLGRHLSGERIINIAVINDISVQIQAEKNLQQSEEKYRQLFENMREGFALQEIIQDENGRVVDFRIIDANPAYEQHTGLKLEEIVGHTLREVTPNADPAMIQQYGEVALTGKALNVEYYSKTFNRHIRVGTFRPQPNHFASIFEDITERKLAEQALQAARDELEQRVAERTAELRQSEEKYAKAFYEAPLARALIRETDMAIVDVNDRFTELFEYNREQILGHSPFELGIGPGPANRAEMDRIVFEERRNLRNYELSTVLPSRKRLDFLISTTAITLSEVNYQMLAFVDITERKRAEEKLAETNLALEKALRVKDEFMAAMSHELRTPLTGILGMAEVLQESNNDRLSERQRKAVDVIEMSGNRLLGLINAVLDYSKLQSGGMAAYPSPCNLADLCQAALNAIRPAAAQKHQQIHFDSEPESITLITDRQLILQLLKYLLENASKFTASTGDFGIEVSGNRAEKLVRLSVWDKGIGIHERDIPRLFQPFVQLDASLARRYEGTGLGLVLVKQIAELLGGRVSVESVFGQGSRFIVTLPWVD